MSEETPIRPVEQKAETQRQAFTVLNEMFGDDEFKTMAGWHMKEPTGDAALVLEANEDTRGEVYPRVTVSLQENGDFSCTVSQHTDAENPSSLYSLTYANNEGNERLTIHFDHPDGFLNDTAITFDGDGKPVETTSHDEDGVEYHITLENEGEKRDDNTTNGYVSTKAKRYLSEWETTTGFTVPHTETLSGGVKEIDIDLIQTFTETTKAWKNGDTNPVIKP